MKKKNLLREKGLGLSQEGASSSRAISSLRLELRGVWATSEECMFSTFPTKSNGVKNRCHIREKET